MESAVLEVQDKLLSRLIMVDIVSQSRSITRWWWWCCCRGDAVIEGVCGVREKRAKAKKEGAAGRYTIHRLTRTQSHHVIIHHTFPLLMTLTE